MSEMTRDELLDALAERVIEIERHVSMLIPPEAHRPQVDNPNPQSAAPASGSKEKP